MIHTTLLYPLFIFWFGLSWIQSHLQLTLYKKDTLKKIDFTSGVYTYATWNPPAMNALAMNIKTVMDTLQNRNSAVNWTNGETTISWKLHTLNVKLPPNTTIEWDDAQREDEEAQCHGPPPSQTINSPQCHQQSYATYTGICTCASILLPYSKLMRIDWWCKFKF